MKNTEIPHTVVILGDGDFPTTAHPLSLLHQADKIICCDGAIIKLMEHTSLKADYIVGDMDTLSPENQQRFQEIIFRDSDQEMNDQTKAFRFARSLHPGHIYLLGATGQREDHTLGNISLLSDYALELSQEKEPATIQMVTDYGTFTAYFDSCTLPCSPGEQISLFAFDPTLQIKSSGLKYPTDQVVFNLWWKATLNEALTENFTLEFNHPARILLFRCHREEDSLEKNPGPLAKY